MAIKLGLLVNPLAGVGGSVGLKGSDGEATVMEAIRRGARPMAVERATRALALLEPAAIELYTWAGAMGQASAEAAGLPCRVLGGAGENSSAEDTRRAAAALMAADVDVLMFAGGDGTARDICDVIGERIPVVGIPAGCKMHSGVYAVNPEGAGRLLTEIAEGQLVNVQEAEVRDIDEDAFRQGVVRARHYGVMRVPVSSRFLQQVKCGGQRDDALEVTELAAWLVEQCGDGNLWLMGSGSTVAEVMAQLGLPNTLLGVDLIQDGRLLASDVTEQQILELPSEARLRALITVIGGQGHVFGRGNQQFSPAVIRRLGREGFTIAATRSKLAALNGRPLLVDSGDADLDQALCGLVPVTAGYDDTVLMKLATDAEVQNTSSEVC